MRTIAVVFFALVCTGCVGKIEYTRPEPAPLIDNTKVIERPRDAVWASAIPNLGKKFFVINTIDKSSGLVNLSYSGDPVRYIDCGQVSSYVKNFAGDRTYTFAGASANEQYEQMVASRIWNTTRTMRLDGRLNLIFEELTNNRTRVTVTTRYVVTRSFSVVEAGTGKTGASSRMIDFNTGSTGAFPLNREGVSTECRATGKLEQEVLQAID